MKIFSRAKDLRKKRGLSISMNFELNIFSSVCAFYHWLLHFKLKFYEFYNYFDMQENIKLKDLQEKQKISIWNLFQYCSYICWLLLVMSHCELKFSKSYLFEKIWNCNVIHWKNKFLLSERSAKTWYFFFFFWWSLQAKCFFMIKSAANVENKFIKDEQ